MPLDNKIVPPQWLRTQFCYDADTGLITNSPNRKGAVAGAQPCYKIPRGYLALKLYYKGIRYTFLAHRLAYALQLGFHPTAEVDHEDTDRTNNRFSNLRDATRSQNVANRVPVTRALPKGVTYVARCRQKPFRAQITAGGRSRHIGNFATPEEAAAAYEVEAIKAFGEYYRRAG